MQDIEQKRRRIETFVKIAVAGVVCFFVSPFIFLAVKGLVGVIIAAGIGLVAVNTAPWFAMKCANWRLRAIKYEASQNPIETLQNEYRDRIDALKRFKFNIEAAAGAVNVFYGKLLEVREKYPKDVAAYEDIYAKMRSTLDGKKQKYINAQGSLAAFDRTIEKAKTMWDLGQAAKDMNKAAGVIDGEDFFSKIKTDTALESVQSSLSSAFADLELVCLDNPVIGKLSSPIPAMITAVEPVTLDLNIEEPALARRK